MPQPKPNAWKQYLKLKREYGSACRAVAMLGARAPEERYEIMQAYETTGKALDDLFSRLIELRTRRAVA